MLDVNGQTEENIRLKAQAAAAVLKQTIAGLPKEEARRKLRKLQQTVAQGKSLGVGVRMRRPVSPYVFVNDTDFLGKRNVLYPGVMQALQEINTGEYVESVMTGGIGSGKTTLAHYTIAYQLYLLSCVDSPHAMFQLDPSSEIVFIFQSLSASHAKQVEYNRFRDLIKHSPYFKEVFPFDRYVESKLVFPNRIECFPVSGESTAAIGQNVIGGILDEVNYMAVIERSRQSIDGGSYDQAWALYESIARRRKSRFIKNGRAYGMLCLVSSKRYPGQFTDINEQERDRQLEETGKTDIYVYDKRVWEVKTEGAYDGEMFRLFVGDDFRKPRILVEGDVIPEDDLPLVMEVPVEYKTEFERDPINALREIAGVSTLARHPYILDTERVADAMQPENKSVFDTEVTDFRGLPLRLYPKRIQRPEEPRWAHIDLSINKDSAGLTIGHVSRFLAVPRGDATEVWPEIVIDGTLEIRPPKGGEILYHKIREVLYKLKQLGMNVKWVSFDSFQSVDSIQVLRNKGFSAGMKSVDTDIRPYSMTKAAIYDGRLLIPPHETLRKELLSVEYDQKRGKVDHPVGGSKDCADTLAGVVYGLTTRRLIWAKHGIKKNSIPASVMEAKEVDSSDENG